MVPAGGVHIRHTLAQTAARRLKIDFVDAVTGFTFKGRQGTAVVEGGVVAEGCGGKVWDVIGELEAEAREEAWRKRSAAALRVWGRLIKGLGVRERVRGYADAHAGEDGGS
ncbi:hypothetical protein LTR53_019210, partial [Teratosphaeriaceae sp. CCFEE 6253]